MVRVSSSYTHTIYGQSVFHLTLIQYMVRVSSSYTHTVYGQSVFILHSYNIWSECLPSYTHTIYGQYDIACIQSELRSVQEYLEKQDDKDTV